MKQDRRRTQDPAIVRSAVEAGRTWDQGRRSVEVRQLIGPIRAGIWLILAAIAVAVLAALLVASQLPVVYEARVSLIAQNMASTYAEVARSRPLLAGATASLGLNLSLDVLAERVQARPSQTSALLTISVRDEDPNRAAAVANAIAEQLVVRAPDISGSSERMPQAIRDDLKTVQREIDRTEAIIDDLSSLPNAAAGVAARLEVQHAQLASLLAVRMSLQTAAISYAQSAVTVLDPAVPPIRPASPSLPLVAITGGLAGLTFGLGLVLVPVYLHGPGPRRVSPRAG